MAVMLLRYALLFLHSRSPSDQRHPTSSANDRPQHLRPRSPAADGPRWWSIDPVVFACAAFQLPVAVVVVRALPRDVSYPCPASLARCFPVSRRTRRPQGAPQDPLSSQARRESQCEVAPSIARLATVAQDQPPNAETLPSD